MTNTGRDSEHETTTREECLTDGSHGTPEYPGVRNQTLNQLIFLKRRLVIEFISEWHNTDYSTWWMTVGEDKERAPDEASGFGEYLHSEVTMENVKEILETYEGCERKRKAYDYLNTLWAIEPEQ